MSAVKEWEKELYIYRLTPAPPKKDDLQKYIDLYFSKKDEKYISWFLHYYEPILNDTVIGIVQRYAMFGHFLDIKQECVVGLYKALQTYVKAEHGNFITYKVRIEWNEIHSYIRTMRTGFTDNSETAYRNLRKIMYLYYQYGDTGDVIKRIADEVKPSEDYVRKAIDAGLMNTNFVDFYLKFADEDSEETTVDVTIDYSTEPYAILSRIELHKSIKEAFKKLNYRQREMLYSHFGLCPECLRFNQPKKTFWEIANENELVSAQAAEDEVKRALEKMRKYLKDKI